MTMEGPVGVEPRGVTWTSRPPTLVGSPRSSSSSSDRLSSASRPRRATSMPKCAYSSTRWPTPKAYDTRPLLMMSSAFISSASRTRSQNGIGTAASRMANRVVRAAIADASRCGAARCPSSAPCSDSTAITAPRVLRPRAHLDSRGVEVRDGRPAHRRTHVESQDEHQRCLKAMTVTATDFNLRFVLI